MTETFPLDEARARTWAPTSCARYARPIALAHSKHNTHVTHSVTQHDKQEASSELMYTDMQKMCVNSDWAIKVRSCDAGCSSLWLSWTYVAQSRVAHRSECLPYSSPSLTEGQQWCPGPTPSGAPCRSC